MASPLGDSPRREPARPPRGDSARGAPGSARSPRGGVALNAGDESHPVREPDLESPRVRAAMRKLGITLADLRGAGETVGNMTPRKAEMLQRKRRGLLAEVEEAAARLADEAAEKLLARDSFSEARETGRSSGWRSARAESRADDRLSTLREQAKNDVLKIREEEELRLKRLQEGNAKDEMVRKRVEEKRKEDDARRNQAIAAKDAAMEKTQHAIKVAAQKRREEARELMQKLHAGFQKGDDTYRKKVEDWQAVSLERSEKFEVVLQRKERQDLVQQTEMAIKYRDKQERTQRRQDDQRQQHQAQAEDEQAKFAQRNERLRRLAEEKQAQREEAFNRTMEKLGIAKESVDLKNLDKQSQTRSKIESASQKHSARMREIRKQRREKNTDLVDTRAQKDERIAQQRNEEHERIKEHRDAMQELVLQNQARLERAQEFDREQKLTHIIKNQARVDGRKEHQEHFLQERRHLLKDFLIEKDLCRDMVRSMKAPRGGYAAVEAPATPQDK